MNIFLAGASGVIGRPLLSCLRAAGHAVTGTTRSPPRPAAIEALGARAVVVDVFDAAALRAGDGRGQARGGDPPAHRPAGRARSGADAAVARAAIARIRIEGTRNLMAAARAAGVRRVIAQSIAFVYAPGPEPLRETDPLDRQRGAARHRRGRDRRSSARR